MKSDSILILGTGALATLFAARFAKTGVRVTMLGTWTEGLSALTKKGVKVEGEGRAIHVHATPNPAECEGMRFALVLVKSWQTERAARQLSNCLADDGVVLTLQNGLGNDTILSGILGLSRVARGVTTIGASLLAPGVVSLGGEGPVSLESHLRLSPLKEMIQQAGFDVNVSGNVQSLIWSKLVVSSAINPLTALLRVKNGELLKQQSARILMGDLARETAAVANLLEITLPFTDSVAAVEEVAQHTATNWSSMLQDVLRGSPTEIESINGAIIRLAEEKNHSVPVNRVVWLMVKALYVRGNITELWSPH